MNSREMVERRRTPAGDWEGPVLYAAELRPDQWAVIQERVSENRLTRT